ncbi:MAG: hypothetical protein GX352_05640 [Clostridiales bacterium]|nr:hypothetical protein [Clostridiales bacterium]
MIDITRQLRRYFIVIAVLSIALITLIANISIHFFFSDYLKESREREDLKAVQYVEQLYSEDREPGARRGMAIMHYAHSEGITIRLKDESDNIIFESSMAGGMHGMMKGKNRRNDSLSLAFVAYPLTYKGEQIGIIEIGRPKNLLSALEDKRFLRPVNGVFAIAFIFSVIIAVMLGTNLSKKFLRPIHQIKGNTDRIEKGEYGKLEDIGTNTLELRELSESVKGLAQRLEYHDMLRKRLTSDVAHELRTPLAAIQSHVEAFLDGVWEPSAEKLSIIHEEITRLTKLIEALSELSLVEGEEIRLHREGLDLSSLLSSVIESFEPMFMGKNINVSKEIQEDIYFTGDRDRLNQIFTNVLSNSYKYTEQGGRVTVRLGQRQGGIIISIEDTGIGIPQSDIQHIFERFYRADLSRHRGTGGVGIGLTITKALVDAHGGKIAIESEGEKGTKITVELPIDFN